VADVVEGGRFAGPVAAFADEGQGLLEIGQGPLRFAQAVIHGVLGSTPQADKLIGYLTKYLTKNVDACHAVETDRQRAHLERLWHELRVYPVLAALRELAAVWRAAEEGPARAARRPVQGACTPARHARTRWASSARLPSVVRQDPG